MFPRSAEALWLRANELLAHVSWQETLLLRPGGTTTDSGVSATTTGEVVDCQLLRLPQYFHEPA